MSRVVPEGTVMELRTMVAQLLLLAEAVSASVKTQDASTPETSTPAVVPVEAAAELTAGAEVTTAAAATVAAATVVSAAATEEGAATTEETTEVSAGATAEETAAAVV